MNNKQFPADGLDQLHFYKTHWQLTEDGEPFHTNTSYLQAVQLNGTPAMLKIVRVSEEYLGNQLMIWWEGEGAARVLAQHENAVLLERATGGQSLTQMTHQGRDDEASRILCQVATRLHAHQKQPPENLHPLSQWYQSLLQNASRHGAVFVEAATIANQLLVTPQDVTVLHGDLHHANVLNFEVRGWLAIDPKGLLGERAFDFANIFCNPDHGVATMPGRLLRQVDIVSKAAKLNPHRLLAWVASWAGLSAIWSVEEGENPETALAVMHMAMAQLRGTAFLK